MIHPAFTQSAARSGNAPRRPRAFLRTFIPRLLPQLSLALLLLLAGPREAVAAPSGKKPVAALNVADGLAVKGYDVVAYFTDSMPVKGVPEFSHRWQGATWRFASASHRAAFIREPAKYAPQYGGYCAFAMSHGGVVDIDPKRWKIENGALYLNNGRIAENLWLRDPKDHIEKANKNWRTIPRHDL